MLSIAVCDDEVMECCGIAGRIKEMLREMKVPCMIRQFYSGWELLRAADSFDIVFLDIIMPGLDGMKAARLFREKTSERLLIFISTSREYVFDAYDVEAFQYLLKPIDDKKLRSVLRRAVRKTEVHSREFIIVSREHLQKKVFLDDIRYFEIQGRLVTIHGTGGSFTYYERIGVLEKELQGKGFFRCHKSFLVNLRYVDAYDRQEAVLDNGEKLMIARRRYEAFCEELLTYMAKSGGSV